MYFIATGIGVVEGCCTSYHMFCIQYGRFADKWVGMCCTRYKNDWRMSRYVCYTRCIRGGGAKGCLVEGCGTTRYAFHILYVRYTVTRCVGDMVVPKCTSSSVECTFGGGIVIC